MSDDNNQEDVKKYAGKFETVEQLEEGYKNSAKIFQENETLKKQLEGFKAPEEYQKPQNIALDDAQFNHLKEIARNTHLTQAQFDKLLMETHARGKRALEEKAAKIKSVGEDQANVLTEYVNREFGDYPEDIKKTLLENILIDERARASALKHRDKLLNSQVPGMNQTTPVTYSVTHEDVLRAREAVNKNPSDLKARDRYLNITAAYAKQSS